jgi:hypothetical protein
MSSDHPVSVFPPRLAYFAFFYILVRKRQLPLRVLRGFKLLDHQTAPLPRPSCVQQP